MEILSSDLLQIGFAKKDFTKKMFTSLLKFDKNKLIEQSEVKGLSGEAAKDKIKVKLKALIETQQIHQEDDDSNFDNMIIPHESSHFLKSKHCNSHKFYTHEQYEEIINSNKTSQLDTYKNSHYNQTGLVFVN